MGLGPVYGWFATRFHRLERALGVTLFRRMSWLPTGREETSRAKQAVGWTLLCSAVLAVACTATVRKAASVVPLPPAPSVETRLYLIGDAGSPDPQGEPVLEALSRELAQAPQQSLAVFLGDNVYPRGLPDPSAPDRADGERKLGAQIDAVVTAGAHGLFIPGNHDWDRHGIRGWDRCRFEAACVAEKGGPRVSLLPAGGCPGPVVRDVGSQLRLVVLDTQWWLQRGPKPEGPDSGCEAGSEPAVVEALRAALAGAGARHVIVLAHHPLVSGGTHGGHFGWRDHLFPLRAFKGWLWLPLPGLGSIYPLARLGGAFSQDIPSAANRHMRESLESALAEHPPFIWASGHEHGLQVLAGRSAKWLLVSGAGIYGHTRTPKRLDTTRFASGGAGFMRLDVARSGGVRLGVLVVDREGRATERFSLDLDETGD